MAHLHLAAILTASERTLSADQKPDSRVLSNNLECGSHSPALVQRAAGGDASGLLPLIDPYEGDGGGEVQTQRLCGTGEKRDNPAGSCRENLGMALSKDKVTSGLSSSN